MNMTNDQFYMLVAAMIQGSLANAVNAADAYSGVQYSKSQLVADSIENVKNGLNQKGIIVESQ